MEKFLKWLDNYWYHYKWRTLIALFFVATFLICTVQLLTRGSYDAYVMYSGPNVFSSEQEAALIDALKNISGDYDKNGSKELCLTKMIVMSDDELSEARRKAESDGSTLAYNFEARRKTIEQFNLEIMTGNSYLCFLSEYMYEQCEGAQRFVPLSELLGERPSAAYDDYAVSVDQTEFGQYFSEALSCMGEGTLVCLRKISVTDASSKKACAEYENYKNMFRNIIEFSLKK